MSNWLSKLFGAKKTQLSTEPKPLEMPDMPQEMSTPPTPEAPSTTGETNYGGEPKVD